MDTCLIDNFKDNVIMNDPTFHHMNVKRSSRYLRWSNVFPGDAVVANGELFTRFFDSASATSIIITRSKPMLVIERCAVNNEVIFTIYSISEGLLTLII